MYNYASMKRIYDDEDIEAYKKIMRHIEETNVAREAFGTAIFCRRNGRMDYKVTGKCLICNTNISAEFGDYNYPIAEKYVGCKNGEPEDLHGFWASVVQLNLN